MNDAGLLGWSVVHGAAFLLIDGRLEVDEPAPDAAFILDIMHDSIWSGVGRPR